MASSIPMLEGVKNANEIMATATMAAIKATSMYRSVGARLSPTDQDVPLFHETFAALAEVINEALTAYFETLQSAPKHATEIEGQYDSDIFDVIVTGRDRDPENLNVEIFLRLA